MNNKDWMNWDWTKWDGELAEQHGLKRHEVYRIRRYHGIPMVKRPVKEKIMKREQSVKESMDKWLSWDWTQQDITLAREHGLSRQRIAQIRIKLGKPKVKRPHNPKKREYTPAVERAIKRYRKRRLKMGYKYFSFFTTPEIGALLKEYYKKLKKDIDIPTCF